MIKKITALLVIICGGLICLHSLFPPRRCVDGMGPSVDRAFLFSDNFYKEAISEEGMIIRGDLGGHVVTLAEYEIFWEKYIMESGFLIGVLITVSGLGRFAKA